MDAIQQGYLGVTGANPLNFGPPIGVGTLQGAPWSGLIGSGIGGVLGGQNMGRAAQELGGFGAGIPMAQTDPVAAAYAQQAQLALQSQLAPPQLVPQGIAGYGPAFLGQAGIGGIFASPYFGFWCKQGAIGR